jgi:hypothetical protein
LAKYMTSLTTHDYLLAATILCTELSLDREKQVFPYTLTGPTRDEIIEAVERSADIWSQMRDESIEAYKASDVLGMLLKKLRRPRDGGRPEAVIRQHGCPTLATIPFPNADATPSARLIYPDAVIPDTGTMVVPQHTYPGDQMPTGNGPAGTTSTDHFTPGIALPPTATLTQTPGHSGFNILNGQPYRQNWVR